MQIRELEFRQGVNHEPLEHLAQNRAKGVDTNKHGRQLRLTGEEEIIFVDALIEFADNGTPMSQE